MPAKREPIQDWFDLPGNAPETLDLPIGGKVYRLEHPGARVTGNLVTMQGALQKAVRHAEQTGQGVDLQADAGLDIDPQQLYEDALGDTYAEMLDDNIPAAALTRAFQAVQAWALHGTLDAAIEVWEGKAQNPLTRSERRNTSTRSPASGSGTKITRKSSPAKKPAKKAAASRGSTSGRSGR